jgi:hypothetical protein
MDFHGENNRLAGFIFVEIHIRSKELIQQTTITGLPVSYS